MHTCLQWARLQIGMMPYRENVIFVIMVSNETLRGTLYTIEENKEKWLFTSQEAKNKLDDPNASFLHNRSEQK